MDLSNLIFYLKCYTGHGHQKTNAREQHSLGKWIMSGRKQININLGKSKPTLIKKISFDLNDPYQDSVVGQGNYSKSTLNTLKDVSSYSFDKLRSYASSNNLTLKFIDVDTNKQISLNDYSEYRFYSQKEHKDTLISTISTLTIKVKKRTYNEPIITPEVTPSI